IGQFPSGGVPYFVFAFAGQLAWMLFAGTLSKSSICLVGNAHLVSKIYFPRLVLPLSTVLGVLLDVGVALVMLVVMLALFHITPSIGILLLPVWAVLVLMIALGLGLFAAALTVTYRDIQYVLPVFLQLMMYASPVAYQLDFAVQKMGGNLKWFFYANPLSGLLEAFRWSLLGVGSLNTGLLTYSVVFAFVIFAFGAFSFRRMERRFADVI
ncbi:MAG: ABC transporter permease, partial [Armatimonadota bacterium]